MNLGFALLIPSLESQKLRSLVKARVKFDGAMMIIACFLFYIATKEITCKTTILIEVKKQKGNKYTIILVIHMKDTIKQYPHHGRFRLCFDNLDFLH